MITSFYDGTEFHCWVAIHKDDPDGQTIQFADDELQAVQDCYGYCVFEGIEV